MKFKLNDKVRVADNYPAERFRGLVGRIEMVKGADNYYPYIVTFDDSEIPDLMFVREAELEPVPTEGKVYIAGPMTGIPEYNFPAFRDATVDLRERGYDVLSPVELDEADGFEPSPQGDNLTPEEYASFLARDIEKIAEANVDAIVVLPGWEKSGGANTEVAFVRALGKPVLAYPDLGVVDPLNTPGSVKDQVDVANALRSGEVLAQQALNGNPKDVMADAEERARLDLLEPAANRQIAAALNDGRKKYGLRNYRKAPVKLRVYLAAIERHLAAYLDGEENASDSGLHHLAHVGANVHIVLAAREAGTLIDDRDEEIAA